MNKTKLIAACTLLVSTVLIFGCASVKQHREYPGFSSAPSKTNVLVSEIQDENFFVLITNRLSRDYNIEKSELGPRFSKIVDAELQKSLSKNAQTSKLPYSRIQQFPAWERQKIDENLYLNVRIPAQGEFVECPQKDPSCPNLLLIHEVSIGANLDPKRIYELSPVEKQEVNGKMLTLVASYSLWDNYRQQYLKSGVVKTEIPMPEPVVDAHFQTLTAALGEEIKTQLGWR